VERTHILLYIWKQRRPFAGGLYIRYYIKPAAAAYIRVFIYIYICTQYFFISVGRVASNGHHEYCIYEHARTRWAAESLPRLFFCCSRNDDARQPYVTEGGGLYSRRSGQRKIEESGAMRVYIYIYIHTMYIVYTYDTLYIKRGFCACI